MNKIIKYILSISMIFLICISNIKATEHSGSITVQLEDFKTSYQDVTLGYYQIAYYDQEYYLTEDFQNLNIDLENIQHASETENFIQMLKTYIDDHDLEAVSQKTNEQGQLTFDDLTIGIYLIVPIESSRYGTIQSSLVEIPMQEDGKPIYDVKIYPKAEPISTETQNDNDEPIESESQVDSKVKTGDEQPVMLYVLIAGVALVGIAAFGLCKKKNKS